MSEKNRNSKYIFGIIFIIIGLLWLLSNLNFIYIEIPDYIFSWQSILIIVGLILLISSNARVPGGILIFIGAYFLIPDLIPSITHHKMFELFLPFLLIIIGISILLKRSSKKKSPAESQIKNNFGDSKTVFDSNINEKTVFGESSTQFNSTDLKGGNITTIFGSTHVDLRNSSFLGDVVQINVKTVFAEANIFVPYDWNVEIKIDKFAAEVKDRRKSPQTSALVKKLILSGSAVFAEVNIYN